MVPRDVLNRKIRDQEIELNLIRARENEVREIVLSLRSGLAFNKFLPTYEGAVSRRVLGIVEKIISIIGDTE